MKSERLHTHNMYILLYTKVVNKENLGNKAAQTTQWHVLSTSETAQVTAMFYKHIELIIAYLATERRDQEAAQCDYGSGSVRGRSWHIRRTITTACCRWMLYSIKQPQLSFN